MSAALKPHPLAPYAEQIKRSVEHFMPRLDWRYVAAQMQQESAFNPQAVSHAGAQGLMQIMPATWEECVRELKAGSMDPFNPADSICVGVYYLREQYNLWSWPRPEADRLCLALASYNAGAGHLLNAQRVANNASDYASIIAALPRITGIRAQETTLYVQLILRNYARLVTEGWQP